MDIILTILCSRGTQKRFSLSILFWEGQCGVILCVTLAGLRYPDIWSHFILNVSMKVFLYEINI